MKIFLIGLLVIGLLSLVSCQTPYEQMQERLDEIPIEQATENVIIEEIIEEPPLEEPVEVVVEEPKIIERGNEQPREVSIQFVKGSPPDASFDNGQLPFEVNLTVTNLGSRRIEKGDCRIELRGFKPSDFNQESSDIIRYLSKNLDSGQSASITFPNFNYVGVLSANNAFPILADYDCGGNQGTIKTEILVRHVTG